VHGGLRAATAFGAACAVAALAAAAAAARKLDASAAATAVCVAVPVVAAPGLAQVRTQCLALVPFVVLYALLATDSRRPTNRVYLVFPLLVVWANLHGSVALGAGLALVYGLTRRPGLVLAPAALLASPYGLHLVAYYRLMLLRPPLAKYVTEWQPPSPHGITLGFFATAVVAAGLYLRHRRALSRFERWALPLLLVAALTAVRNVLWFELALAVSLPSLIDAAWPRATRAPGRRVGIAVAAASIVLAAFVVAAQLQRPAAWFDGKRTPALAASVAQAAGAHGLVAASDLDADWLLWQQPALAGRVVYDVRFELFDGPELRGLRALEGGRPVGWASCGVDVVLTPARRVVRLGGSRAPRPRACPASPSASHA
jgi:hypothetical protein